LPKRRPGESFEITYNFQYLENNKTDDEGEGDEMKKITYGSFLGGEGGGLREDV